MVAIGPALRVALKVAPIALEVTRQLDRQLRPHLLAYGAARSVDGYVGRWVGESGSHWVVFASPTDAPLKVFPPLSEVELDVVARELDRSTLRHHSELTEAKARDAALSIRSAPAKTLGRLRRDRG